MPPLARLPPASFLCYPHRPLPPRPLITRLFLQLAALCAVPRAARAAGLSLDDFASHMAFLWTFMFERLAPFAHPAGRMVLVADCRGLRLAAAMGDGQAAGRALGAVAEANPERMAKTLVVNAPAWFNLVWKVVSPHLAESTRAKVSVLTTPAEARAELARHLPLEAAPAELGGRWLAPLDELPAQRALLEHVAALRKRGGAGSVNGGANSAANASGVGSVGGGCDAAAAACEDAGSSGAETARALAANT